MIAGHNASPLRPDHTGDALCRSLHLQLTDFSLWASTIANWTRSRRCLCSMTTAKQYGMAVRVFLM